MSAIREVDADAFQLLVIDASRRVPVLVDFWAVWCAPCRALKPVLEKLAAEYGGRFILAKVDSDRNQEIAARYGVRGIPCVKAFVDGEVVREFTGALPEAAIRSFIDAVLPSPAEPLLAAAREARARGDADIARSLLDDAAALDPSNPEVHLDQVEIDIDAGRFEDAGRRLDGMPAASRDSTRAIALRARIKLVAAAGTTAPSALAARIESNPGDLDARFQLAAALAAEEDYRGALEQWLEVVRRDRRWGDDAARRAMLDLFALLGASPEHDDLMREFRVRLARTLN